ncbi:Acetohydroxy acid synthase [Rubellimicrobium mesophilum DSM 19309]|uniref:Acetohydroxy acid synthase n=1 Tax=Rubellimicrobium mesophilum DSM 19309 TaxID=442562 RepID=A0A017HL02_9RHOB|nr:5-guanidino-2-oxopentanoate decarboxylase [Rubellimicrobium mesophilum]EYD75167.1 Acetohydroxy acid synthase [Rubellimicrobium mesophilum DSM 19309]
MRTVGTALVEGLVARGVDTVFGIPGVHTLELYRGLAGSPLRHVTPRHEQGAGFMAEGHARATGRPGVAFVITGPGLTNILTPMAQARSESIPMLVISSTLPRHTLGRGTGALHELPDQRRLMESVALWSHTLLDPRNLPEALDRAFATATTGRPGPIHLEIPMDVLALPCDALPPPAAPLAPARPDPAAIEEAARRLAASRRPVILAGGGARRAAVPLRALAEALDAPVVTTVNGRGLLAHHPLSVPASPYLPPVRALLREADAVLALGTEFGPTDYETYEAGVMPSLAGLIRVEIDPAQVARGPRPDLALLADARSAAEALLDALPLDPRPGDGTLRATHLRDAARATLIPAHQRALSVLETIRATLPGTPLVGDSTEPIYAGNLFFEPDAPGLWFNSAMGFGTLGYALPAAIGRALADPSRPVVALAGDGGLQFTLSELGSLADAKAPVIVLVWNSNGYAEIELAVREAGVTPIGVTPSAPDFVAVARAYGLPAERATSLDALPGLLRQAAERGGPALIDLPTAVVHGT